MKKLLLSSLALFFPLAATASASIHYDLTSPAVIAVLDHQAMPVQAVDLLYRVAQRSQADLTRQQVTARLIENHLLANYAQKTYGDEALFDGQRVGFRQSVTLENQLVSTLQNGLQKPLATAMAAHGGVNHYILHSNALSAADFDRVFGPTTATLLEYRLDPAHEAIAKGVPLLSYRFDGGSEASISLFDVYEFQNVQGRNMMYGRDGHYIADQAKLLLEHRFVLDWAARRSGLGPQDVAFIRQAVADRARRDELEHYMGLDQNLEEGTEYLRKLAASVTPAEIQEFYQAHKDAFKQIDRARARHIEVVKEQDAKDAYDALSKGGDFAATAKKYSIATDAAAGGEMGWVPYPKDQSIPWLLQLVFTQTPGVLSRPVRTPMDNGEAHWQIVYVEEITQSYLPADSNEVKFAASESLSRKKAFENFASLRQQLVANADIQVNPKLLPLDSLTF